MAAAEARGLEGIVAKLRRSRYEPGRRTPAWLKLKVRPEQELVVGGWTPGEGNATRPRRGRGRRLRGRQAAVRRQGRLGVHGDDAEASCSRRWRRSSTDDAAVRPAATAGLPRPLGRRARRHHVDPAGARDPGRARRLDARRHRPPDGVQGDRARAATRRPSIREEPVASDGRPRRGGSRGRAENPRDRRPKRRRRRTEAHRRRSQEAPAKAAEDREPAARGHDRDARRARPRRARGARAMPATRASGVGRPGDDLKLTNLDKILFPPAPDGAGEPARHEARADRATSPGSRRRCCRTSRSGRSTSSGSRTAPTGPGFWQKDIPSTAPAWLPPLAARSGSRREDRKANEHLIADRVGDAVLARQPGRVRGPRLDVAARRAVPARRSRSIDIDPGDEDDLGGDARRSPGSTGPRSGTSACAATRRRPASAGSRSGSRSSRSTRSARRATGSRGCRRAVGSTVPDLVSWEWAKGSRGGKARLDYTQNT